VPTLLVVDDEKNILGFVSEAMTRRGWSVVQAATVEAGLEAARRDKFDVALCDVIMPKRSGLEFVDAVSAGPGAMPVVLMTGHPTAATETNPGRTGPPPRVLEKPFRIKELEKALNGALANDPLLR
jgi:DNA-binding NtrC family response regulator